VSVRRKIFTAATALALAGGAGAAGVVFAAPAHASTEFCTQFDVGGHSVTKCLNAWNGGPEVADYSPNVPNDAFNFYRDEDACNDGYTTTNCPISGVPTGLEIVYFPYAGGGTYNGDCIADYGGSSGDAAAGLAGCGAYGYLFVQQSTSCGISFISDHWSSSWSTRVGLGFALNGLNGNQAYLNNDTVNCY
jgi:hypothetical protein